METNNEYEGYLEYLLEYAPVKNVKNISLRYDSGLLSGQLNVNINKNSIPFLIEYLKKLQEYHDKD